jgi:ubiquinone/menaquinone biosynthesis C-methylase UbiE
MKIANIFNNAKLYELFQFGVARRGTTEIVRNQVLKPYGVKKVLDFGCGIGYHSKEFIGSEYLGIEPLSDCVNKANRMFKNSGNNFIVGDHDSLKSIKDSSYDLIIALGVLHHINDSIFDEFIKESHRILKAGGRLTTFDPVYHKDQSKISKWVVSRDRGTWIRTTEGYSERIQKIYNQEPSKKIYTNLLRIPYDHIALEVLKV